MTTRFDIIIAGGGTAGCVLANRLSADGRRTVALIEAGPDTPPNHTDAVLWDSYPIVAYFDPRHHWTDLRVHYQPPPASGDDLRKPRRYEQAKVMGGGSSINGMMANRGAPGDFDEWETLGAAGWSWNDVLPYYRKLERDLDISGPAHGSDGPLPIRRVARAEWPGYSRAVGEALGASGLPFVPDQNDGFGPAWFPITVNNADDRRASTATAYLDESVRRRPNLTILANTRVSSVTFDGRKVTGIEVIDSQGWRTIEANEVVLALGAIHTPAMLLRSGTGNGEQLQKLGIDVRMDRPGVGRNLQEHPQIAISALLDPSARQPWSQRRHIFAGFRYSSEVPGCVDTDMYGVVVNRGAWHPLGQKLGGVLLWVNKAYSQGWVELSGADPDREPAVELNLLSDERDLQRLEDGLRRMANLFRHPALSAVARYPFPTSYTERSRDLAVVTLENRLRTEPIARALDGPAPIRRRVMRSKVAGGSSLFELVRDENALRSFLRERVHGTWHCCGTAKMGREDDPMAVTDPSGRVYGVQGLRVADASLMPTVPRANTNLPVIMIGEKIADALIREAT